MNGNGSKTNVPDRFPSQYLSSMLERRIVFINLRCRKIFIVIHVELRLKNSVPKGV